MSKRRTGYWLLAAGVLALAVFAAPRLARGDRDDSDKLLDHYLRAYNNGDPAALAELYTEDALFLPHERSIVHGRKGIQDFWRRRIQSDHLRQAGRPLLIKTLGENIGSDVGYVVGAFERRDGETGINFALGIKRDDKGEWRIAAEVWNSTELKPRYQPVS
ncbi:MAG TPA: nuclear transport factor 2 family protein [Thermoanaerobaculia bacterium]|nr:nuclear transport factor 2 family protein [Thermoanaerobaculia bacterium]